jgi:hypothetical protein
MTRIIWLIAGLAGAFLLAWQGSETSPPLPATAPPAEFSAERALVDIRQIAARPHPIASPANALVRDYLMARMTALGLQPQIQEADALSHSDRYPEWLAGARVQNLIGVLPGADRSLPALILMAHYDSVAGSPGAADDATGVAAALEVIRAVKVRGTPVRDIIVLFTDGEEFALSGAEAFFARHPLAARTGLIINMEARGGGGRANMFETGADNGDLINAFKASANRPISSALAVFLYEKMPNDTDFSIPKAKGMTGLNFAFIGRQFDYHSPTSTVANLDKGSVQSMGDQVLAATGDLAFAAKLPGKAPSAVYSQTFGDHVLSYPPMFGWLVWALAGALLLIAGWRARRAGEVVGWRDGLRGAGGGLLVLTGAALLMHVARRATGAGFGFMEQRPLLAQWHLWETSLILLALAPVLLVALAQNATVRRRWAWVSLLLAIGAISSLFGGFDPVALGLGVVSALLVALTLGQPVNRSGAWAGLLLLGLVIAGLLQVFLPQVAFLVAWPLTLAAVGAAASRWGADHRLWPLQALIVAVVGAWLGVYFHLTAQGLDFPALLGLFSLLAAFALWPLAPEEGDNRSQGIVALMVASLPLLVAVFVTRVIMPGSGPWTERFPEAVDLFHVTDTHAGKAWLASTQESAWSDTALRQGDSDSRRIAKASLPPFADRPIQIAQAALVPVDAPTLTSRTAPDGRVEIILTRPSGARTARINIKLNAAVDDVRVQGQPAKGWLSKPGVWNRLRWVGPGEPVVLSFKPSKPGAAEVDYASILEAWPQQAAPIPQTTATTMLWGQGGSTVVTGKTIVRW